MCQQKKELQGIERWTFHSLGAMLLNSLVAFWVAITAHSPREIYRERELSAAHVQAIA